MRRQKAEGRRRKSRRGIVTTVVTPRWQRNLKAALRVLKRYMLYIFAAIGLVWASWQVMLYLVSRVGGG